MSVHNLNMLAFVLPWDFRKLGLAEIFTWSISNDMPTLKKYQLKTEA
jgi:hypothetical protein